MSFQEYFSNIRGEFSGGRATEHSYRPALKDLLESFDSDIQATNEPKRQQCGAPDFILTKKEIPLGYLEAKDIGIDLNAEEKSGQMKRYLEGLPNLILTDYLEFRFFQEGEKKETVRIAEMQNGKLLALEENFGTAERLLRNFLGYQGSTITSASRLASMMAGKAQIMRDVLLRAVKSEEKNSPLHTQLNAFRQILIHDMTEEQFADMYAQTIAYGLFAARLHDDSLENFSRQEAAYLLPKSNPFLRKLFNDIAGVDLDARIVWIVDELAELFSYCDVREILANFGRATRRQDPVLHFYETFLAEYDPKLRKARGVYYTPEPVVDFIVRAIDGVLKAEFGLNDGLADTSKIEVSFEQQGKKIKKQVHRVQVLDPATGTGTFLNDIIRLIAGKYAAQKGVWQKYVEEHLIPRLHGFELLMASYAMCHLKLDLTLEQSGFDWREAKEQRLNVYLTNSLEEAQTDTASLFAQWLSNEANEANTIKRDMPIMVVTGNPPYAVSSSNASVGEDGRKTWIGELLDDYKKNLNEKKLNLDDDYIKFLRYAQYYIKKNGQGIVAMITNNSFLDGVTHRRMRQSLLQTFDKIYIYDLHGNSKKKESAPDGGKDENVFDIMQGVGISIMVRSAPRKTGAKKAKSRLPEEILKFARDLRKNQTDAEAKLWAVLRNRQFGGLKFRRQHPLEKYIVDFYCHERKLVIELDGGQHAEETQRQKDLLRDETLKKSGHTVLRFWNSEVFENFDGVLEKVWEISRPLPDPLPEGEGGKMAEVWHYDSFGRRQEKYDRLHEDTVETVPWKKLKPVQPYYFFVPKDFGAQKKYEEGFSIPEIFPEYNSGIQTKRDKIAIQFTDEELNKIRDNFERLEPEEVRSKYGLPADGRDWKINWAREDLIKNNPKLCDILYRPFDVRKTLFTGKSKGFMGYPRTQTMKHVLNDNLALVCTRLNRQISTGYFFITNKILDLHALDSAKDSMHLFPLYLYPDTSQQNLLDTPDRTPNLNPEILKQIETKIGLPFSDSLSPRERAGERAFTPEDLLDYIYAVLHSPTYRQKYKEFLKIDFPRIPFVTDKKIFRKLVELGRQLREYHLMTHPKINDLLTKFPVAGEGIVEKVNFVPTSKGKGRVFLNEQQYFEDVPHSAWEFHIGGYQPAQKWLKDRKGRVLSFDDILHWQKIIVALSATERLMGEIDEAFKDF